MLEKKKSRECEKKGLLTKKAKDHRRGKLEQIVQFFPLEFNIKILNLCHEGVSAYLDSIKIKDKILYYFCSNVIRDAI